MPTARARPQHEILQLQQEIFNEVQGDSDHLSKAVFGDVDNQPDLGRISNQRLDDLYRQAYQRNDRQFLQREARRDPEQFLKATERIGVRMPPPAPAPMMGPPPAPDPPVPAAPIPGVSSATPLPPAGPAVPGAGGLALPAPVMPPVPAVPPAPPVPPPMMPA